MVTWKQQGDKHWFGANIPGELVSVEVVEPTYNNNKMAVGYKRLLGQSLEADRDTLQNSSRVALILNQKPSVMP